MEQEICFYCICSCVHKNTLCYRHGKRFFFVLSNSSWCV